MSRLLFFTFIFFSSIKIFSQDNLSASKHVKLAKKLIEENKIAAAAAHYEAAWSLKPKKLEWLHEAARFYLQAREYRKAAESFGTVKDNKFFPQARLNYAKSLQQSGQYDEAIPEFLLYLNSYEGKDREQVKDKIEDYINGCTMGIRQTDSTLLSKIEIEHLSENINSTNDDFAPVPFGEDVLYFTSTSNNSMRILRSQQLSKDWSLAQNLEKLPILPTVSFGNGAFSPDGSRFYFTENEIYKNKKVVKNIQSIWYMKRSDKGWATPVRLSDRINTEGGTSTHPSVFHKNNREYLYFSSDKKGGRGGMDIWYVSRDLKNEGFDDPINVGNIVNTEGDEVTPFYDVEEGTLYFASDGRATLGGLDIFKTKGEPQKWITPENLGLPFNSGADDCFFIKNKSHTGGYFVSNRSIGMEKISSRDDDIFAFKLNDKKEILVAGKVMDKESKSIVESPRISLYEKRDKENQRLLTSLMSTEGAFNFVILPLKGYSIEVEKDGYRLANFDFSTKDSSKNLAHDFYLEKYTLLASVKVEIPTAKKEVEKQTNVRKKKEDKTPKPTAETVAKPQNTEGFPKPAKPVLVAGVTYKVQVMAYESLDNTNRRRISRVDDLGDLDTEQALVNGKNFTRVMLATFNSYSEAVSILRKVKDRTLADAFIVKYENGQRTNKSR